MAGFKEKKANKASTAWRQMTVGSGSEEEDYYDITTDSSRDDTGEMSFEEIFETNEEGNGAEETQEDERSNKLEATSNTMSIAEIKIERSQDGDFSIDLDKPEGRKKISLDDFIIVALIGQGAYGKVHVVQRKETKEVYAMKVMRKDFLLKSNNIAYTITERNILKKVRHPFLVSLHFAFQTQGKLYLIMDYISGGQLMRQMRLNTMLKEQEVRFYAAEIILALEYLHQEKIVHRDLKPENILIGKDGHLVITDFGLAKIDYDENSARTFCGTLEYMAPEILTGKPYGKAVDYWALGILIFDMLTGAPPFTSTNRGTLQKKITMGKYRIPRYIGPDVANFIKLLLCKDAEARLGSGKEGIQNLKKHKFFKNINWKKLEHLDIEPPCKPILTSSTDFTNFEEEYTKNKAGDSPVIGDCMLTSSQQKAFLNFSYVRSFDDACCVNEVIADGNSEDDDYEEPEDETTNDGEECDNNP